MAAHALTLIGAIARPAVLDPSAKKPSQNFPFLRATRALGPFSVETMSPLDPESARSFLEAIVVGFSILGGGMAYLSGYKASEALAEGQSPEIVGQRVDEGIALGFRGSWPASVVALILMVWSG